MQHVLTYKLSIDQVVADIHRYAKFHTTYILYYSADQYIRLAFIHFILPVANGLGYGHLP